MLANLITNAVKFTHDGRVRVWAATTTRSDGSIGIRCEIADTGIGVEAASLERMFEPFTQADTSTTRQYGGTGLGLAIARELIAMMGGSIGADSQPGRGSTFWFELTLRAPRAGAGPPALGEPPARPPGCVASAPPPLVGGQGVPAPCCPDGAPPGAAASAPLVLVVDDSPVNQIVAVGVLRRCGCRSQVAADGHEALRALAACAFDAVLMDCQMPGMDGYEATSRLRITEGRGRRTPVIAMTAHVMNGDRERCLAAGMDDYISEPIRHEALAGVLRQWISEAVAGGARVAPLSRT